MKPSQFQVAPSMLWVASAVGLAVVVACGGQTSGAVQHEDNETSGGSASGIGAPCVPDNESDPTFQGFSIDDVSVELNAAACGAGVCLVNHFQGRVSCPYGQTAPDMGPTGPAGSNAQAVHSQYGCGVPGAVPGASGFAARDQVTATNVSEPGFSAGQVPAQVVGAGAADRTANKTVYCSCRCANADGETNDGAAYCACPSGSSCTQVITSVGSTDTDVSGAYCVLDGTQYNAALASDSTCDASAASAAQAGYCPPQR